MEILAEYYLSDASVPRSEDASEEGIRFSTISIECQEAGDAGDVADIDADTYWEGEGR